MSDTSNTSESDEPDDGTQKPGGLGSEGTIPNEPGSVGVGAGEPTTFEPEEDPDAAARRDPEAPGDPESPGDGDGTSANDADANSHRRTRSAVIRTCTPPDTCIPS